MFSENTMGNAADLGACVVTMIYLRLAGNVLMLFQKVFTGAASKEMGDRIET